ncbi:hypothetical protein G7046_g6610 [Stylonectria norvegica]|nr:hypothetical protein G7046_g6610 [Stylonectria norvegica]
MTAPTAIAIGIELEFMVAQHKHSSSKTSKSSSSDGRWAFDAPPSTAITELQGSGLSPWADLACVLKVCETVASEGHPVACYHEQKSHPQNPIMKNVPKDAIIAAEGQRGLRVWNKKAAVKTSTAVSRSGYWLVVRESDIAADMRLRPVNVSPRGYNWFATGINSPIIYSQKDLQEGLPKLRKILTTLQNNVMIWLNSKCGLHIHVGDITRPLDLDMTKRVVSLVYLLESPLLLQLCHKVRHTSSHAAMICEASRLVSEDIWPANPLVGEGTVHLKGLEDLMERIKRRGRVNSHTHRTLERIWSEPSLASLRVVLRRHQGTGISSQCGLAISEQDTIVFRYPEASFDTAYITRWAILVRHIFSLATRPIEEFTELLCRVYELVTRDEQPGWPSVLATLGFSVHPDEWRDRIKEYRHGLHDLDGQPILPVVK